LLGAATATGVAGLAWPNNGLVEKKTATIKTGLARRIGIKFQSTVAAIAE
jgi:hypothetical protein